MTSFNLNHLLEGLSPDITTLVLRASLASWRDRTQFIAMIPLDLTYFAKDFELEARVTYF